MISDSDLLRFNKAGLVPGPNEIEEDFLKRTAYCLNLKENIAKEESIPFPKESLDDGKALEESFSLTEPYFDIAPSWMPVFYSNYQLHLWHGGCAWIFQMKENSPKGAFLQLRRNFQYSKTFMKIYSREELISHEISHVGRMMFEEPHYEEILAYRTSQSTWRSWLGPIIQSAAESTIFVLALGLIILLDIYLLITGQYETFALTSWAKIIPIAMILFALARLWKRHQTFNQCLRKLESMTGNNKDANAVIYRLTDEEIDHFAFCSENEIREYIRNDDSLRWRLIALTYLKKKQFI